MVNSRKVIAVYKDKDGDIVGIFAEYSGLGQFSEKERDRSEYLTIETAIDKIQNNVDEYFTNVNNIRAEIYVVDGSYLSTTRDKSKHNNLDDLPVRPAPTCFEL